MSKETDPQHFRGLQEELEKNLRKMTCDLWIAAVGMSIFMALLIEGGQSTNSLIPSFGSLMVAAKGASLALIRNHERHELRREENRRISEARRAAVLQGFDSIK